MKQYSLWQNICYVYKQAFQFHKQFLYTIPVEMILSILLPLLGTLVPTCAVNLLEEGADLSRFLIVMGIICLFCVIVNCVKSFLNMYNNNRFVTVRIHTFLVSIFKKTLRTSYSNVEPSEKQILLEKAMMGVRGNIVGVEGLMRYFPPFIISLVSLCIYASFLGAINGVILLILFTMTIVNLGCSLYAQKIYEKGREKSAQYYKRQRYLYENSVSPVNGKDMRIYQIEEWFSNLFQKLLSDQRRHNWKILGPFVLPQFSDSGFLLIRDLIAYTILIRMVADGNLSIAGFTFYINLIGGFTTLLNQAVDSYENLRQCSISINAYRYYVEFPEKETNKQIKGKEALSKLNGPMSIEFKDVTFTYPDAKQPTIPRLNLTIRPGEKIALVGVNGAGKTSIVKLLAGFYSPNHGSILVNGQDISALTAADYLKKVGIVFQETFILAFSIAQNVACCLEEEINYPRVRQCLDLAGLWEKVNSLEEKERTVLTKKLKPDGILLSGGETQKLMLARALYKDAPLMILDEPTAALDPIAEAEMYEKYRQLTEDKTSIFISHRLASTQFCDRILFLENGKVVEEGTHQQLMVAGGKYARMFEVQSSYYKKKLRGRV